MSHVENKVEEVKGRAKQTIGSATGDDELRQEGRLDEIKADVKQAVEKVKDALHRD